MPTLAHPPLTPQQRAALDARDRSVSLAAGAGCGKTFVLTERFIAELDPTNAGDVAALDQLVAITFTDAAAREMRDRIRRRCFDRLRTAATPREAGAWQRLMRSIEQARISTIHSFCTALLRAHAVEARLDPQFEVLDAPAAELLRLETIDDRLRALLLDRNEDVLTLAAERGLDRLRTDLAAFSGPWHASATEQWRAKSPDELVAHWVEAYQRDAPRLAAEELLGSGEIRELRRWADPSLVVTARVQQHLAQLADELRTERVLDQPLGASLATIQALARVQGVCKVADWDNAADFERYKKAAQKLRDLIKCLAPQKPTDLDAARHAASLGLALVRLAADASTALEAAKARRNQLEFDDLLARAKTLLLDPANEAIRQQTAGRTRLMMVDEFQDTNRLQLDIIQAFCGDAWRERGLFVVGDFKQSIYRFNGAAPEVSTRLRESLPAQSRLSLTTNFRSQPAVIDFINAVFHDAFQDYEPLVAERQQVTPTPAVEFLWSPGPNAARDDESDHPGAAPRRRRGATAESRREEARWIARRLRQLLDLPDEIIVDAKSRVPRRLQPGDIAILLRSLSDAQSYEEGLREAGLDYYLAGGHAFYSQQEIFDVLNLLRAVTSSVDEIALAGALRSPLFALTDETLFWLVTEHGSLNSALAAETPPRQLAADDAAKVRRASATLDRLRRAKDELLASELLALALELTGYDATLLAEFLGPRKAANIEKLLEQARAIDHTAPGDLPAFITQLSEFVLQAPKEALAATQTEGDVIRIMTIHYAKGLEFPLVVLPDLERRRHAGGAEPVLDAQLGPLVPLADRDGALGWDLYRRLEDVADLDERKRLLYVACTRAADYLILSSSIDDIDNPRSDWLQLVDTRVSLADGELRGNLPPGYHAPQVRVTAERPTSEAPDGGVRRGADLDRLVVKTRELVANKSARPALPREAEPVPPDASARRRFSFSQITGQLTPLERLSPDGEADTPSADDEIEQSALGDGGGRAFGTLVHSVLQRIDFRRPLDARRLAGFLAPQLIRAAPSSAAVAAAELIEKFLRTPLAAELAAAPVVRREVEFLLPWPPPLNSSGPLPLEGRDGEGGAPRKTLPYLHGYLDCLYQDAAGRWRLIDYKTNRVTSRQVPSVAATYELQMLAYRLACEQVLGEPLAECTLVFLHPGVPHPLSWDAAAERRGIERITAVIASIRQGTKQPQ
jgi:ATP-dependent helicase/nuclease subunit A